ncbi:alpha/beta hydrolase [Marinomonas sp. THO17]|uniref:alpha/beta fold hydrolase n=1 Tax=Marinomonas sp. THO17 TaxID=3149048 RepID=UPI00336BBF17
MTDLYCLPGTMCDERLWQPLQSLLNDVNLFHQVIPVAFSIDDILSELAESLPDTPFHLLGFSMGGYLATAFALRFPSRIKSLVVLSNLASGLLESEKQQRLVALNWVRKQGYSGIPRKKAQAMLGRHAAKNDDLVELIQAMDKTLGEKILLQQLTASLERPDLQNEIVQASFPVTVMTGGEDALLPEQDKQRYIAENRIRYIEIAEVGHMLPLECPQQIASILQQALVVSS